MINGLKVAEFSPCRKYRYTLIRELTAKSMFDAPQQEKLCQFICLNPSTADELKDDPTVRRCCGYARDWGCTHFCMTNIFAWRDTDPRNMFAAKEPIGVDNDYWIKRISEMAAIVIAAWGNHGVHLNRFESVKAIVGNLHYLRMSKTGQPCHPLYLPKDLKPIPLT